MTASAKPDPCLISVTTDGTQSSDCPAAATVTAHGTHSGKGPTRRIVGVASLRPKLATKSAPQDSTTLTPLSPRHTHRQRPHQSYRRRDLVAPEDNPVVNHDAWTCSLSHNTA